MGEVYDALADQAVARFAATLDRFEAGEQMQACAGREAYHRKGMPNDAWFSFYWSNAFLVRFSLALDFAPYLPGRVRIQKGAACTEDAAKDLWLAVESTSSSSDVEKDASVGE